jgi:hypothetical protein
MLACDACGRWVHTRCQGVPDEAPPPDEFLCLLCAKRTRQR